MHLLDLNFLLALFFQQHPHHRKAQEYYEEIKPFGWASCPSTENAFIRVGLQQAFISESINSEHLRLSLKLWKKSSPHQFWTDDISITEELIISIPDHGSVTDLYLLALAVKKGGKLVTFDKRIQPEFVQGGSDALIVLV